MVYQLSIKRVSFLYEQCLYYTLIKELDHLLSFYCIKINFYFFI